MLINFASAQNMVIGSNTFEHRDINKMTWKLSDINTFNQIDYVLIDARQLFNLININRYRGVKLILISF